MVPKSLYVAQTPEAISLLESKKLKKSLSLSVNKLQVFFPNKLQVSEGLRMWAQVEEAKR